MTAVELTINRELPASGSIFASSVEFVMCAMVTRTSILSTCTIANNLELARLNDEVATSGAGARTHEMLFQNSKQCCEVRASGIPLLCIAQRWHG
jgi:hypothetical protein